MQVVTFETAQKLKEAGFPQPNFEFGQFWYAPNGHLCAMSWSRIYSNEVRVMLENGNVMYLNTYDIVFAPTATDILQRLGSNFVLWFDESPKMQKWICSKTGASWVEAGRPIINDNPAEAAWLAWLALNQK